MGLGRSPFLVFLFDVREIGIVVAGFVVIIDFGIQLCLIDFGILFQKNMEELQSRLPKPVPEFVASCRFLE